MIGLALDGQSTLNLPNYLWPIFAYTLTLIVVGVSEAKRASTLSMLYGVALVANLAAYFLQYWFTYGSVPLWKGC